MTMIDTADSRFAKAVALADQAGQWAKCRTRDGGKAYGIRSSRNPNRMYLVTKTSCDCFDAKRHPTQLCKHQVAVHIHCCRMAGKPMPASDLVDALEQLVVDRQGPVLDMIREPDGSTRWERHQHPSGDTFYMPRRTSALPAATVELAARYDEIMSRFNDDTPAEIMGRL